MQQNQQKILNLQEQGSQLKLQHILSKVNFLNQNCQFQKKEHLPIQVRKQSIQAICFKLNSILMASFQIESKLFYAFAALKEASQDVLSQIIFYEFKKENGQHKKFEIRQIKGYVTALKIDLIFNINLKDKISHNKSKQPSLYTFIIIIGTKDGYLKKICLETQQIQSKKLANRSVVQITSYKAISKKNNFYFVLMQNANIFLVNIHNFDILIKYCPNIVRQIDLALNMVIDWSQSFLLQSTRSGYIIIWDLHKENHEKLIQKSVQSQFLPKNLATDVFSIFNSHSIVRDGILFVDFFGNLLFLITVEYRLKIISIDLKNTSSFIVLFQYLLPSAPRQVPQTSQFLCFKLVPESLCFYYSIQAQKHSIYKLKLNDFMQIESIKKFKIKGLKKIQQFCINQSQQYYLARDDDKFAIKYMAIQKEEEIMQFQY